MTEDEMVGLHHRLNGHELAKMRTAAQETPDAAALGPSSAPATCSDTPEGFGYLATNSPRSLKGGFNSIFFTDSEKRIKDCSLPQGLGFLFLPPGKQTHKTVFSTAWLSSSSSSSSFSLC